MASDIEIARAGALRPIAKIAAKLNIPEDALKAYGTDKAKIALPWIEAQRDKPSGRLVLVTAMSPTPMGEGKTTTAVGLGDALGALGQRAAICLREPSLGPCFGMKGGAAGGGYSQVVPMEDINLHFTGDFHAIGAANNLLSAMIDNHVHWDNDLGIDPRRVTWRRAVDMNDRALREVVCGLGGVTGGIPRQDGFDITVASEIMAVLCLSENREDLTRRLGDIVVAENFSREEVTARDLKADGAMSVLLKDALEPNLVQTLEGTPAFVHGGPFANIAHGCNSLIATRTALKTADIVVTEAGFGADLGAEKFFNIKCRKGDLHPDAAVIVATIRALKVHGGADKAALAREDCESLKKGLVNLSRHVENVRHFGVPQVVAINRFPGDTDGEIDLVRQHCAELGVGVSVCTHFTEGSKGALDLARQVMAVIAEKDNTFRFLYPDEMSLWDKVRTVAQSVYGAQGIIADKKIRGKFQHLQDTGHGNLPVCIAKTPYSFSTDPDLKGAPSNHVMPMRDVRLSAGAGFVVVICGDIMTMPGLPRRPAAEKIHFDDAGRIEGLF
ncbi:formate--tetrahydrofolate ligase [Varunaivibrio sulfuroxidans]|nr:formate--tetrahydrofolate ligase [Varunaivibrio sulfuroxidans]WES32241.1 formate--tetrahydrofolate ligase [Varunaivibrio sulfuroxidans]